MFPEYNSLTSFYLSRISSLLQAVKVYVRNLLSCFQECVSTPSSWILIPWRMKVLQVILFQDLLSVLVCSHFILSLITNSTNISWILQNGCMQLPKSVRCILKSLTVKLNFKGTRTGLFILQIPIFVLTFIVHLKGSSKDFYPSWFPWETALRIKSTIGIMTFKINDYVSVF